MLRPNKEKQDKTHQKSKCISDSSSKAGAILSQNKLFEASSKQNTVILIFKALTDAQHITTFPN